MSCENESQHPANERQRPQSGTHLNEQTRQNSENTPKSLRSSGEASSAGGALVASHSYSNSNTNPSPAAVEEAIASARRVGSEQCRAISRSTSSLHQLGKGFSLDSHSPGGEKRRRAMHTSRSQHKNSNTEQNAAFRSLMKHHTSSGNALPALLIASPAVSSGRISNLLSRIKERIQKHAIQTSSDWPLPPTLLRQASGQRMKLASAAAACSTPDSASARDAAAPCNWTPGSAMSTRRQDRTRSLDSNSKENYSLTPESAGRAHLSRCTRLRAISSTVQPNLALLELQQQQEVALQKIQTPGSSRGTPTTGCSRRPDAKIELLGESEEPETRVSEWTSMRSPPDFYLRKRSSSSIDPSNKQPVRKLSARVESSQHSVTRLDTILIPGSTQMLDSPAYTSTCSSRTESPVLNTRRVGSRNGPQRLPPSLTLTVDSDEAARCALEEAVDESAQQHCDAGARPSGGCNSANRSLRVRQMKDTRNWLAVQEDLPSVITEKSEHSDRSASSYGNGDRKPERSGASGSTRDRDRATDTNATASASKPEDTSRGEKDTSRREKRRNSGKGTTKTKKKVLKRVSSLRQGSTSSSDDCSRGIGERVVVDIEPSRYKQSCGESGRLSELNYDADGTTWGIWGADVDPEELGAAIQAHLQRLMQTAAATARQPAVGEQVVPKSARPSLASGGGGDREGEQQQQQQQHKQQAQERDSQSQQRRSARPSLQGSGSERGSKAGAVSRQSLTSQERRSAGARGEPKTPIEISERIEVIEAPSSDSQELPRKRGGCRFFNCIG